MKSKFWDTNNILISLKALITSIVTALIFAIPIYLIRLIENIALKMCLSFAGIIFYLLTWGYLSKKWWNWK